MATQTITPTPTQFPQWEFDLLKALNAPVSVNNLTALNLWAQSEGSVTNNALAASGKDAGASKCVAQCDSKSPVYEYDNEADGVAHMARFLGGSYYTGIVHALQQDAGLAAIYQAINSSAWCKGCEGGQYPVALAQAVGGKSPGVSSGVGAGGGTTGGAGNQTGASPGAGLSTCVIQMPGFLFFSGPCILTKGGVKWLSGVAALLAGTAVGAFGIVLLAAYGFDRSGAKQAATKVAGTLPTPVGKAIKMGSRAQKATGAAKKAPGITAPTPSGRQGPLAGAAERRDERQGERRLAATERQQGPIGVRGGSSTSRRIAADARRGRSVPGAGNRARRQPSAEERRRRAGQPF